MNEERPPVIKEVLEQIWRELDESRKSRTHIKGDPVIFNGDERREWEETGQVFVYWNDGTQGWIMSMERKKQLMERFGP